MQFNWRPEKEARNIADRDISFAFALQVWLGDVLDLASPRAHSGELRRIAIGAIEAVVYVVVYVMTDNDTTHHIISARRASRQERRLYANR